MEMSNYAEVAVQRDMKKFVVRYLIFWIILSIYITMGLIMFNIPGFFVLVFVILAIVACFLIWREKDVEYEYTICDGRVNFAKIRGNIKRKTLLKADLYEAVYLGPSECDEIIEKSDEVTNRMDLTSRTKDAKEYTLILKSDNKVYAIRFEPNLKFLECARWKMTRKYKLYDEDQKALMQNNKKED